jgi:GT2 family glycosyltransferase
MDREGDAMSAPVVLVLVATYRRPEELRRLGECLSGQTQPVAGVVVVDNAGDMATRMLVETFPVPATYLAAEANRGCGAGLRKAEEHALGNREATHWWILDDDAVPPPEALEKLVKALEKSGAGMAVPLLTDDRGRVWGFPEPVDPEQRRFFRRTDDYSESAKYFGSQPHACIWATGACQLVTVAAAAKAGLHRDDFWMLGEDLDFSMRVARSVGAVFIGDVRVPHLPPAASGPDSGRGYAKFCALLQNLTYLAFWNRGSAHLWRYLPGNYRRFFRTEGWSGRTLRDAGDCFVSGLLGVPAAQGAGERVRGKGIVSGS